MKTSRLWAITLFVGLSAGCLGLSDTQVNALRTLSVAAGDNQAARTGGALPIPPKVLLVDKDGAPVPNVTVTFAVASGGGTITSGAPVTGADGTAAVGGWVMGATAGTNTLTATIPGVKGSPLTFTALGQSRTITKVTGDNQTGVVGTAVAIKPKIKIADQNGTGFAGITVTFAVASGGGSVTGGTVVTAADGTATVGNWVLGASAGTNTLTATAAGVTGSPVTFTATGAAAFRVP